jgi:hypothetical protein
MHRPHLKTIILLFLVGFALISSCSIINNIQPTAIPTKIPPPKSTPTQKPSRVILIAPDNTDPVQISNAQKTITKLAASASLTFETRKQITGSEITPDVKILIFLTHPDNLGALANSAPKTQFVVVSDRDWSPTPNVTIIRQRADYIGFAAGYLSVVLDNNFRGGALIATEDTLTQQVFQNGGYYYCGLCRPEIPPYSTYPIIATQPKGSPATNWQSVFDQMNINQIKALYVSADAYSPELFTYLVSKNVILFGPQTPPDVAKSRWAATLRVDGLTPLTEIWTDVIAGKGGKIVYVGVEFDDVQSNLLPQGKMDYVNRMVNKMRVGLLNPQSVASQ